VIDMVHKTFCDDCGEEIADGPVVFIMKCESYVTKEKNFYKSKELCESCSKRIGKEFGLG